MSEETVQVNVQESLDVKAESKPEDADSGLNQAYQQVKQDMMKYKSQRNELRDAQEKERQKQLSDDGKKDELIAELNLGREKDQSELKRLRKYEDDEKTNLVASISSDDKEAEELSKESLSTLRLLKNKIAAKSPEVPTARGSVGYQPPADITKMSQEDRKKNWSDIIKQYTNK